MLLKLKIYRGVGRRLSRRYEFHEESAMTRYFCILGNSLLVAYIFTN